MKFVLSGCHSRTGRTGTAVLQLINTGKSADIVPRAYRSFIQVDCIWQDMQRIRVDDDGRPVLFQCVVDGVGRTAFGRTVEDGRDKVWLWTEKRTLLLFRGNVLFGAGKQPAHAVFIFAANLTPPYGITVSWPDFSGWNRIKNPPDKPLNP